MDTLCFQKESNLWSQSLVLSITENNIFSLKCGKKKILLLILIVLKQ